MGDVLAIMFTFTTYGSWLRGDARGWVDKGIVFAPDPLLAEADRRRMRHPPFRFEADAWPQVGRWVAAALAERFGVGLYAMSVGPWHVHFLTGATSCPVEAIAKRAKDAVRWGLRPGRPVWTQGFDKRYCYDEAAVRARIAYIEGHNLAAGLSARPWGFIEPFPFI